MRKVINLLKPNNVSLVIRTVFYFGTLMVVVWIFLGSLLFSYFRDQICQEQYWSLQSSLDYIDLIFNQCIQDAKDISTELYDSNEVRNVRLSTSSSNMISGLIQISKLIKKDSDIHSVYILNRNHETALHYTNGINYTVELEEILPELLTLENNRNVPFVWKVQSQYEETKMIPLLCVYTRETLNDSKHYAGTVVVNIDLLKINEAIFSSLSNTEFTEFYILNSDGIVIAHSGGKYFGEDFSNREAIANIIRGDIFVQQEKLDNVLYEFQAVSSRQKGFYLVAQYDYNKQMGKIQSVFLLIFIIVVILSVGVTILFYLASKLVFLPIKKIVEDIRFDSWSKELIDCYGNEVLYLKQYHQSVSEYINKLKAKEEKDVLVKKMMMNYPVYSLLVEKGILGNNREYGLIMMYMLNVDEQCDFNEINIRYDCICEKIIETLKESGKCTQFEFGIRKRLFCLLEDTDGGEFAEKYKKVLQVISENAEKYSILIMAEYIGNNNQSFDQVYKRLNGKMRTRLLLGSEHLMIIEDKPCVSENIDYCNMVELKKSIIQNVQEGNRDIYIENLELLFKLMRDLAWDKFRDYLAEVAFDILVTYESMISSDIREKNRWKIREEIDDIIEKNTLIEYFNSLFDRVRYKLQEVDSCSMSSVIERAVDYINNCYDNADINRNFLAEKMNVSTSYFGKLFKEYTGLSVSEYLTKVRMEKAHSILLIGADKGIAQVAKEVGYDNEKYFATVFKKYFGVSPSKLRDYMGLYNE